MNAFNGQLIGRSTAYIFIETIGGFISGYLLWLILTRIASPDAIGTASTLVSLASIFTIVATLGVPTGASRFLAKFFHENNLNEARIIVKSSLILVLFGIICSVITLLAIKDWLNLDLDLSLTVFTSLIISSAAMSILVQSIIIASLRTKVIPIVTIVASSIRVIAVIIFVLFGAGALGIVMGHSFYSIIVSVLLGLAVIGLLGTQKEKSVKKTGTYFKTILKASIPSWVPRLITAIGGANLGTVIVFGSNGSIEAASFFIANAILIAINSTVTPLHEISYPALSAMSDGRKRFTWRIIKICVIILSPLSVSIIFYSPDIINLFGNDYNEASLFVRIMILSVIPMTVSTMISQLVYAYGNYRQVLYIGLAASIPRTVLYFLLVPSFGGTGAAVSFLVGSIIGFIFSIVVAKKIGVKFHWKNLILINIFLFFIGFMFSYLQVHFIIGIVGIIIVSLVAFLRFKILTGTDVQDILSVLPKRIARPLNLFLSKVGGSLNKDYSANGYID